MDFSQETFDMFKYYPSNSNNNKKKRKFETNSEDNMVKSRKKVSQNNVNKKKYRKAEINTASQIMDIHDLTEYDFSQYQESKNNEIYYKQNENSGVNNKNDQNEQNMDFDNDVIKNIMTNSQEYKTFLSSVITEVQKLFGMDVDTNKQVRFHLNNETRENVLKVLQHAVFLAVKPHPENVIRAKSSSPMQQSPNISSADDKKNKFTINSDFEIYSVQQRKEANRQKIKAEYFPTIGNSSWSTVTDSMYTEPALPPWSNSASFTKENILSQTKPHDNLNAFSTPTSTIAIATSRNLMPQSLIQNQTQQRNLLFNMYANSKQHNAPYQGYRNMELQTIIPPTTTSGPVSVEEYMKLYAAQYQQLILQHQMQQ